MSRPQQEAFTRWLLCLGPALTGVINTVMKAIHTPKKAQVHTAKVWVLATAVLGLPFRTRAHTLTQSTAAPSPCSSAF